MSRSSSVLLLLGLSVCMAAGCGDKDSPGLDDTATDDTATDDTSAAERIIVYVDQDQDSYGADDKPALELRDDEPLPAGYVYRAGDCDDADAEVHPGGQEVCGGRDEDCDGLVDDEDDSLSLNDVVFGFVDGDGDGFGGDELSWSCSGDGLSDNSEDCDDSDPDIYPGAPERCNGLDDDCDGFDDTLGYWPMGEGGGAVIASSGGLGLDGVITNATWTDGFDGSANSALEFHGDSYVTVLNEDDALLPEHGLTVSAWVRPNSFSEDSWDTVLGVGDTDRSSNAYWLGYRHHKAMWGLADARVDYVLLDEDTSTSHLGTWHHLLATWDSVTRVQALYIDGDAVSVSPMVGPPALTSFGGPLRIGADTNSGNLSAFFDGTIDEVKLFSCAIDDAQAEADFNQRWPF